MKFNISLLCIIYWKLTELFPNRKPLKKILYSLGFVDAWIFQGVGDGVMFLSWLLSFRVQPYLKWFKINKFIQSFARLRVSSHRLQIEAGRWTKPLGTPISYRKCLICNKIEDEYHFVIECGMYVDIRIKYIARKYWIGHNKHVN